MAKSKAKSVVLRLMSQAGTGYYYTFRRVQKGVQEKLQLMKFDPVVNRHVLFKEERIKK
jgi:large subunit ribosomal protein L33